LGGCEGERGVSLEAREEGLWQALITSHRYQKVLPTGTFAEPEEVAHVVSMLVQDLACNINGADIKIDGGYTIR
jgi:NAD(P)-dependent dehydrogenase (short-subunit alcohol dehydrogenase family)